MLTGKYNYNIKERQWLHQSEQERFFYSNKNYKTLNHVQAINVVGQFMLYYKYVFWIRGGAALFRDQGWWEQLLEHHLEHKHLSYQRREKGQENEVLAIILKHTHVFPTFLSSSNMWLCLTLSMRGNVNFWISGNKCYSSVENLANIYHKPTQMKRLSTDRPNF